MKVTIKDVARATGLSVATISRVLNDKEVVRVETREKVLEAARRLRWAPHVGARSLTTKTTHTVGVLLPDIYGEFFSEVIRGLDAAARRNGYHVIVSGAHNESRDTEEALRAMRGRVDGLIVMSPHVDARALVTHLPESVPVVLLNGEPDAPFASLDVDNYGGAFAMTRHLLRVGHRRIAFVAGPAGNRDADDRLRGYRDAMHRAREEGVEERVFPGDFGEEAGFCAGRTVASLDPRPTAVFCANDAMAIACLAALRAEKLAVPEEVALAGFDDIPIARFMSPPLTTVHVAIARLGERAMETLLSALAARIRPEPRHEPFPASLVVRGSCGAGVRTRALAPPAGELPAPGTSPSTDDESSKGGRRKGT